MRSKWLPLLAEATGDLTAADAVPVINAAVGVLQPCSLAIGRVAGMCLITRSGRWRHN
jgi:hypothetical protein